MKASLTQVITRLYSHLREDYDPRSALTSEEVADVIWLAKRIARQKNIPQKDGEPARHLPRQDSPVNDPEAQSARSEVPPEPLNDEKGEADKETTSTSGEGKIGAFPGLEPSSEGDTVRPGVNVRAPGADALPGKLRLARALRPLTVRISSRRRVILDEIATAEHIAQDGLWLPVLKPDLERWLTLSIIVDRSRSMDLWRRTVFEFSEMVRWLGAFRDIRLWSLRLQDGEGRLEAGFSAKRKSHHSPKELGDALGRHLVLLMTDCVSKPWWDGTYQRFLADLGSRGPLAVVQLLPEKLWPRTALRHARPIRYSSLTYPAGLGDFSRVNYEYSLGGTFGKNVDGIGTRAPILSLHPGSFSRWGRWLTGREEWAPGYELLMRPENVTISRGDDREKHDRNSRFEIFWETASSHTRYLFYCAGVAPIVTLPILRAIREAMIPNASQANEAELLLSGLLEIVNDSEDPEEVRYCFPDDIRARLLDNLPRSEILKVLSLKKISEFIEKNVGRRMSLPLFFESEAGLERFKASDGGEFAAIDESLALRLASMYGHIFDAEKLPVKFGRFGLGRHGDDGSDVDGDEIYDAHVEGGETKKKAQREAGAIVGAAISKSTEIFSKGRVVSQGGTISWLHLSDLHACNPRHGWDAGRVTETLVEDLRRWQSEEGLRPDLLLFTGDAAFGQIGSEPEKTVAGQLEEFARFLEAARTTFEPEIPLENVFLVPGNHDVNRTYVSEFETEWLDSRAEKGEPEKVTALIHEGGLAWSRFMERLADYRAFLESYGLSHLLTDSERLIYSTIREVKGYRIGIAGFNSAWSSCRDGERGRLWMAGRWQQEMLLPGHRDADFSIALMHHPPDWLVEYETPDFGRGLERDFRFLLHGHEHRAWVLSSYGYNIIASAACYERSDSEHNGYNVVRLVPEEGRGEVWLRRYDAAGGGWVKRVVAKKAEDGVWPMQLDWLGALWNALKNEVATSPALSEASGEETAPGTAGEPSEDVQAEETTTEVLVGYPSALERYLQRLRAKHRDLPLAGFETKVRLPIQIQDVYIPLRARVARAVTERENRPFGAMRELDVMLGAREESERDIAFEEAIELARSHHLRGAVVLGDPGSGKTTLLKHFVLAATDPLIGPASLGLPEDTVPVLVELRRLKDPRAGLEAAIEDAVGWADVSVDDAQAFARELMKRDRLLVLVDGLDEVADKKEREAVSRWLEKAIMDLDESTFIVTSRYAGYKGDARLDGRFLELHVRDVEEEAAKRFIGAWYLAVESQADFGRDEEMAAGIASEGAEDLASKIFAPEDERTKSLWQLASNPLMLQILCLVHRDRKQLPGRRVELYRECVLVLLELWRRAKGLLLSFDAQQALRLLQPLAYHLHVEERRELDLQDFLPHLEPPLRELRRDPADGVKLLEAIRDQSGILVSLGQSSFGFLHLSFQEYLTARYVQDRFSLDPSILRELASRFGDPWWREVILLSLGLNNPSLFEPLMEAILNAGVLHRDAALADDCLRDALATSARPFVAALAAGIAADEERYQALRLLKGVSGWESVEVDGVSGREVVERLAREETYPQARSMALELLGDEAAVEEEPGAPAIIAPRERERVNEKDGSVLVYVPGGEFTIGADDISHKEKPIHTVKLSPFWMGKYPVTNAQYRGFLEANESQAKPERWNDKRFNEPEQPVVGVSWLEAMVYCRWAGLELPSEAQWEAAARGVDGRRYPWGDEEPTRELANFGRREGQTAPVGAYPKGAGPYGTLDQGGNVWEWCRDEFVEDAYLDRDGKKDPIVVGKDDHDETAWRVVRGGSWLDSSRFLPVAFRRGYRARECREVLGFRVLSVSVPEHDGF